VTSVPYFQMCRSFPVRVCVIVCGGGVCGCEYLRLCVVVYVCTLCLYT